MSNFTANASQAGQQGGGGQRRMHPIRPLTIKQLLDAQANTVGDAALVVDGREVTQATVVGRIVRSSADGAGAGAVTARHLEYVISDNTGLLAVRQWMEGDQQLTPLPTGTHVRAAGTVKVWNNAPIVTGTVVAVMDSNEVSYHMLDVILTHLRLTRGTRRPLSAAGGAGAGAAVPNTAAAIGAQNMLPGGGKDVLLTDLLADTMRARGGDMGLSMDELMAVAQRYSFSSGDVRAAMRTLIAEGRSFQTHENRYNV